jgi:hypothetical protein
MGLKKRRKTLTPEIPAKSSLDGRRFNHKSNTSNDEGFYLIEIIDGVIEVSWDINGTKQSTTYELEDILGYIDLKEWILI